jgi:TusE/DsrC/DsvC family sulfur relay protein
MAPNTQGNTWLQQDNVHHLQELQYWSLITAYGLAAAAGIKLNQQHIELLYWVRAVYDQTGRCDKDTLLMKLEKDFGTKTARDYLKRLFPSDPVSHWLRIAGLPVLAESQQIH